MFFFIFLNVFNLKQKKNIYKITKNFCFRFQKNLISVNQKKLFEKQKTKPKTKYMENFIIYYSSFFLFYFISIFFYRSICENCHYAKWKTFEKEEDKYQKMHPQPLL